MGDSGGGPKMMYVVAGILFFAFFFGALIKSGLLADFWTIIIDNATRGRMDW